jgi:hypothetical protein
MRGSDESARERAELRRRYKSAYDRLAARLFGEDQVGFKFGRNSDEYEPEVGSILPRLASCRGLEDIQRIPGDGAAVLLPLWERASVCMG